MSQFLSPAVLVLPLLAVLQAGPEHHRHVPPGQSALILPSCQLRVTLTAPDRSVRMQGVLVLASGGLPSQSQDRVFSLDPASGDRPLDWPALLEPGRGGHHV